MLTPAPMTPLEKHSEAAEEPRAPIHRGIGKSIEQLDGVRWIGPGRWVATCPCCGEVGGAEFANVWQGAEVAGRESVQ